MTALGVFLFSSELIFRFLPIITDTGIQIWNGFTVNNISIHGTYYFYMLMTIIYLINPSGDFHYPEALCCREPRILESARKKRSSDGNSNIYEGSLSFDIKISWEGALSLGLVQLPGICLGLLGVFKAFQLHGLSKQTAKDSLRSSLLFFLPFFIVEMIEFVHFILSSGVNLCCGIICSKFGEKIVSKFDLLFFLGQKDKTGKEKILALDAAKVFFGSVLQLSVQLYFIEISRKDIRVSQYISVISSLLLICKTGYEVMTYRRKAETQDEQDKSFTQKARQLLKTLLDFLSWLPLLGSNLVFKMGIINLGLLFLGWYAMLVFLLIFLTNLLSAILATNEKMKKCLRNYQITHNNVPDNNERKNTTDILHLIYTSYSNIFLLTRTVATQSASDLNLALLLQPLHFLLGFIFLCVFKSWNFWFDEYNISGYYPNHPDYYFYDSNSTFQIASENTATSILVCGFISLCLCFINWDCKVGRKKENLRPIDVELGESKTIKDNP